MIEINHLSLTYPSPRGPVHALQDIDLRIAAGEVFGIIGRSGAGKSSLVRTLNLLNRPSSGKVKVAGQELTALNERALREARRGIGMVFQHFNLLSSRTVYDNAALPLELAGMDKRAIAERVHPLLELVGLAQLADRYPAQISGGQKQRVGIARALASRPKLLLSDEATSALDPETTRAILALLRRINQEMGLTIVLITHQMQVIKQIADRVAVIDGGRIVEQGPVIDLFLRPQHATTRRLIDENVPQELPDRVWQRAAAMQALLPSGRASQVLRLSYAGAVAQTPFLSELARAHDVDLALLHGQVDEVHGEPFGSLAVLASGEAPALAATRERLTALGFVVDVPMAPAFDSERVEEGV